MNNTLTPAQIPLCGLGTFGLTGDVGIAAILSAMEIGYRHLDTAQSYGTEASVAAALRRSGLPRREFFVTTKVADTNLGKAHFLPSVERSLEVLGLDQIDLLLIHWPSKDEQVPFEFAPSDLVSRRLLKAHPESHALEQQLDRCWSCFVEEASFRVALGDGINLSPG